MARATPVLSALVLAALEDGPAHGYRIARWVDEHSAGCLALREGSLYPILHALEQQGAVDATWEREGERQRRVYRLTEAGRAALRAGRTAWRAYADAVERALFKGGARVAPA